ncbi:MAG: anaerobic sulfite reductase subunit AsrB [Candidatus Riflebacteria bacterium]|nr:anaerobic sulfite reductase subunit AsrB [Candidatus Riflebacteria bacterium]
MSAQTTANPYLPFVTKIIAVKAETESEFTLTVQAVCSITPGQFFQVSLPRIGEAPISVSNYGSDWIQFTIRAVGKLTGAIQNLKTGENLFIRGPYGTGFPVDRFKNSRLVIVAGGSGVAPVRPLVDQVVNGQLPVKSLDLIAGFKNRASIIFTDDLVQWQQKSNLTLTIDKQEEGWDGATGLVTEHIRKLRFDTFDDLQVIVVGPPVMMKFATAEFRMLQVPAERIWVSFERLMSCGLGKCGHCKIDYTYVCVDGPVLNYSYAANLID